MQTDTFQGDATTLRAIVECPFSLAFLDMLQTIGEVKKDRDAEDPDDASQAYVATEIEGDGEDKKGSEKNHGAEGNKDSGGGGDPLASPPAQEDRVVVAHDGGQRGEANAPVDQN